MGPSTLGTGSMQNPLREPPEVLNDRTGAARLTPKRDVWDLGCLAFKSSLEHGLLILPMKSKKQILLRLRG